MVGDVWGRLQCRACGAPAMAAEHGRVRQACTVILTKSFSEADFDRALESWSWLDLQNKTPIFTSLFGDVFFASPDGFWFLDSLEGTLTRSWSSRDEIQADLDSESGQDQYLLGGLAMAVEQGGIRLGPSQIYDFVIPPKLGGSFSVENVAAAEFVVAMNIAGQLLQQVKDLPPGTPITGFAIDGE